MKTEVTTITPQRAKEILEAHNKRIESGDSINRPISQGVIKKYAADMRNGTWLLNPQPIIFDDDGNLLDGQHRLWAVVQSNKPIDFNVTHGTCLERNGLKTMDVIDRGRPRSLNQQLAIGHGYSNAAQIAAVARIIGVICSDIYIHMSLPQTLTILRDHKFDQEFQIVWETFNKKNVFPSGVLGVLAWYMRAHRNKGMKFAQDLSSLENQGKGSPVLALFRWLQNNRGLRRHQQLHIACTAQAIKFFHDGKELDKVAPSLESAKWIRNLNKPLADQIKTLF